MDVPVFVRRDNIEYDITIPNMGKEGKRREYISRKAVNGLEDQTFTSDDCPSSFTGIYIGEEEDPGNGKLHPSYLVPVTEKSWIPFGKQGVVAATQDFELDSIARKLLAQQGIANIRSVRESDLRDVDIPTGRYWLSTPASVIYDDGVRFGLKYVYNGEVKSFELYDTCNLNVHEKAGDIEACILAVVSIDTVIEDDEPRETARTLWNFL